MLRKTVFCVSCLGLLVLAGCSNPEAAVIGTWQQGNDSLVFGADHTVKGGSGGSAVEGTWKLASKKLTILVDKMGGKTKAEIEKQIDEQMSMAGAMASKLKPMVDKMKDVMDNGQVFTLSDDGKTLSAPNPMSGMMGGAGGSTSQTITLTKKSN
jgi:hypothetical protein